jgi:hypothetical protein
MARRSYGTGSLSVHTDARGREAWYGKWYIRLQTSPAADWAEAQARHPRGPYPRPG